MAVLSNLEPYSVFHYFEEICSIPHGSGNTKQISDYCVSFAKKHNLRYIQDASNNIIIFKDGTKGYEESAPVILQGHLDMVCEKTKDCTIDFEKEGLELILEGDTISANGTTLGGDDGIAVAYSLAILASDDIPHPPLQVIFTVDEEIGMLGAEALDCSPITSRIMLNIDSEEEGIFWVSCAGGATADCHIPVTRNLVEGRKILLTIHGLAGGHSGAEIHKGGANASVLLGRALYMLTKEMDFTLLSVEGGLKDNAIPKEAVAALLIKEEDIQTAEAFVEKYEKIFSHEYSVRDPQLAFCLEIQGNVQENGMDEVSKQQVLTALMNFPNGVQSMSMSIPGLVQTSLNLGILVTKEEEMIFTYSVRSSVSSEKEALFARLSSLSAYLGGTMIIDGDYPAWEYKEESPLRDLMVEVFEEQYGYAPKIEAIHAGLECGLFSGKMPGLDCISIGPDMKDIHTSDEILYVESTKRTWEFILAVLKRLR